ISVPKLNKNGKLELEIKIAEGAEPTLLSAADLNKLFSSKSSEVYTINKKEQSSGTTADPAKTERDSLLDEVLSQIPAPSGTVFRREVTKVTCIPAKDALPKDWDRDDVVKMDDLICTRSAKQVFNYKDKDGKQKTVDLEGSSLPLGDDEGTGKSSSPTSANATTTTNVTKKIFRASDDDDDEDDDEVLKLSSSAMSSSSSKSGETFSSSSSTRSANQNLQMRCASLNADEDRTDPTVAAKRAWAAHQYH
ncbi:unnamed protein product, partial [Amoebophrya sp. A25]